jgi:predicted  nucleic acid-binding Zn-ribbon protein
VQTKVCYCTLFSLAVKVSIGLQRGFILKTKHTSTTISFRIDSKLASDLTKRAIAKRLSLHEYTRDIFLDALAERELRDELVELHGQVQDVSTAIEDLRHDLSVLFTNVLAELTDLEPEEAESWIASNF